MSSLFAGTCKKENPQEIYEKMESNYSRALVSRALVSRAPISRAPISRSEVLWKLRNATCISTHNPSPETLLEKAVSNLAESCHMTGWFNQCPTAAGIAHPRKDNGRCVDLVHWSESNWHGRLIELKWKSNNPRSALRQILRYGVAYVFCRVNKMALPLQGEYSRPLMDAQKISLEVVAPHMFYGGHNERNRFARVSESIDEFARSMTNGELSMSLNAMVFPEEFTRVPFESGQDVIDRCLTEKLTTKGRIVRDAFEGLVPTWPAPAN